MSDATPSSVGRASRTAEGPALIVPVRVSALSVNQGTRNGNVFYRAEPLFGGAAHRSPERPWSSTGSGDPGDGVYVHWELPAALRAGAHDPRTGVTTLPAVPNRWLVVRYSGTKGARTATAGWLVHSDCLRDTPPTFDDNSPYPGAVHGRNRRIGRLVDLMTQAWAEPDKAGFTLTAAPTGLPVFAVYQPYNQGVFSLRDACAGLTSPAQLSYQVIGWFSDTARDPLHAVADERSFAAALGELGWQAPGGVAATTRSLYAGASIDVAWDSTTYQPGGSDPAPEPASVTVAIAETSIEAVMALFDDPAWKPGQRQRAEAFLYGMLDQLGRHDGLATVSRLVHQARFEPVPSGDRWELGPASDPPTSTGASEPGASHRPAGGRIGDAPAFTGVDEQLAEVNRLQERRDDGGRELARLQQRLYQLWWCRQEVAAACAATDDEGYKKVLDTLCTKIDAQITRPPATGSLAERVQNLTTTIAGWDRQIGKALDGLPAAVRVRLRRVPRPPFHQAAEPVVMLRGANAAALVGDTGLLPCRTRDHLVKRLAGKEWPAAPSTPKHFEELRTLPAVPGHVRDHLVDLLREHTLFGWVSSSEFDAGLRSGVADRAVRRGTAFWRQPWTPLRLLWRASYYPIPYRDVTNPALRNWTFTGATYTWKGSGHTAKNDGLRSLTLQGSVLLTPAALRNVAARATQAINETSDTTQHDWLNDLKTRILRADLLSQALDGFNERLVSWQAPAHRTPPAQIAVQVGRQHTHAPVVTVQPDPDCVKFPEKVLHPFATEQLRGGQFQLTDLILVDRFGRAVTIVHHNHLNLRNDKIKRAATVLPARRNGKDVTVDNGYPSQLAQLTPRLAQPARLRLDVLSPTDSGLIVTPTAQNLQICGWIVPNYLDRGLLTYTPEGTLLGELRTGAKTLLWQNAPPYQEGLEGLAGPYPQLHAFLTGMTTADGRASGALDAFTAVVDDARELIDPRGPEPASRALHLLGKPLALLRVQVGLETDGPPVVTIRHHLAPKGSADSKDPDYLTYPWPVQIGCDEALTDGLIGFLDGTDTTSLRTVLDPADVEPNPYIAPQPGRWVEFVLGATPRKLTLVFDPLSTVTAISHILPAAHLELPADAVAATLARMDTTFRVGPALITTRMTAHAAPTAASAADLRPAPGTVVMVPTEVHAYPVALPVLEHGQWSWQEHTTSNTTITTPVTAVDTTAHLTGDTPPRLRTGRLRLHGGLTPHRPPDSRTGPGADPEDTEDTTDTGGTTPKGT